MGESKSITALSQLYTVVVGLALALGVGSVVGSETTELSWTRALAGGAVIATLIPFYHGGLRHLQDTYRNDAVVRPGLILWDFVLLFVEACLLLAAASSLHDASRVAVALILLWGVDIAWVTGSRLLGQAPPMAWAGANCVAVILLGGLVASGALSTNPELAAGLLLFIALGRTVADYALSRPFYFPPAELGDDAGVSA